MSYKNAFALAKHHFPLASLFCVPYSILQLKNFYNFKSLLISIENSCIKAPTDNEYNIEENKEYDIVDGTIKNVVQPYPFVDIRDINCYYKDKGIKFKVSEIINI